MRRKTAVAQFKLRMPEPLREAVEQSAKRSGNSINTEIVQRLGQSFDCEALRKQAAEARARELEMQNRLNLLVDRLLQIKGVI